MSFARLFLGNLLGGLVGLLLFYGIVFLGFMLTGDA